MRKALRFPNSEVSHMTFFPDKFEGQALNLYLKFIVLVNLQDFKVLNTRAANATKGNESKMTYIRFTQ